MILNKKVPIRYIFNKVRFDLGVVVLVGIVTNVLTVKFSRFLPDMPISIPALLGTAISILLSFKMNQSYERWWEARKVWGAIVNDSRSFVLQLQSFLPAEEQQTIKKLAYRQIAWCYTLGRSLRGLTAKEGYERLIAPDDQLEVSKHTNKALAILQLNSRDLKALRQQNKLEVFTQIQLDNTMIRFIDSMGMAERINNTVFPSTYRHYLHFTVYLFVITFSISLKQVNMIFEIPLLLAIAAAFFLIEKSAYHLQDPFRNRPSDIPVTAIATTIDINIRQLLGESNVPEPPKTDDFFIL